MPESLESRLTAALAPARAPDELWEKVNSVLPSPAGNIRRSVWPRLAMAAAVAGLMTGGVLYLRAANHWNGPPTAEATRFATESARIHRGRHGSATDPIEGAYVVERHVLGGQPVTIVSVAAAFTDIQPGRKSLETIDMDEVAVSEWTSQGRTWALVAPKSVHLKTCSICHRA